jgi:hypothetical protein
LAVIHPKAEARAEEVALPGNVQAFVATSTCARTFPAYKEEPPTAFNESNGWQHAQPGDDKIRADWWGIFGSTELKVFEEQINPSNQPHKCGISALRGVG